MLRSLVLLSLTAPSVVGDATTVGQGRAAVGQTIGGIPVVGDGACDVLLSPLLVAAALPPARLPSPAARFVR